MPIPTAAPIALNIIANFVVLDIIVIVASYPFREL
jgi:hypothetical protein